jgi:hypothetical protein
METGYWIETEGDVGVIQGRDGLTPFTVQWLEEYGYVHGPDGQTGYVLRLGRIFGPGGADTGFYTMARRGRTYVYGPSRTPPWLSP